MKEKKVKECIGFYSNMGGGIMIPLSIVDNFLTNEHNKQDALTLYILVALFTLKFGKEKDEELNDTDIRNHLTWRSDRISEAKRTLKEELNK